VALLNGAKDSAENSRERVAVKVESWLFQTHFLSA
jgi:hypothetical protein